MKIKCNLKLENINSRHEDNLVGLINALAETNKRIKLNPELYKQREPGSDMVVLDGFGNKVTL